MSGSKSGPAAPDYGPLADANRYKADRIYKSTQDTIAMQREHFNEMLPLRKRDIERQEQYTRSAISSLNQQRRLLDENAERSREGYDKFKETIDRTNPEAWEQVGNEALTRLQKGLKDGSYVQSEFKFDAEDFKESPGYQFRQDEGQKAAERALAAQGITGGAAAKALQQHGQQTASAEFDDAFARAAQTYDINAKRRSTLYLQDTSMSEGAQEQLMQVAGGYGAMSNARDPTSGYSANAAGFGGAGAGQSAALGALGNLYSGYSASYGANRMRGAEAQGSGAIGAANAGIMQQQAKIDRWKAGQENLMGWANVGTSAAAAM